MTKETAYHMLLKNGKIFHGLLSELKKPTLEFIAKKDPLTNKYTHYIDEIYYGFANVTVKKEIEIILVVTETRECYNKKQIEYLRKNVHDTFTEKLSKMYLKNVSKS